MARGNLWSDSEVAALIAIWGEEEIQCQLDGTTRNKKVYRKIAAKLQDNDGFERTAVQCREKIKKLKSEYRRARDRNNKSGRGRTICTFFTQLDAILGCRPASAPSNVVASEPGPSTVQENSSRPVEDEPDQDARVDNEEEEEERDNTPANEGMLRKYKAVLEC